MVGLGRSVNRFLMEGDGGAGGAPNGGAPVVPPRQAETFSREYVTELREESRSHRTRNADLQTALNTANEKIAGFEKSGADALAAAKTEADARVLRAELKFFANKHGVVDVADALKVLDLSTVKFDADGNVIGADELFEAAKTAKPYLFKAVTTSTTEPKPKPKTNEPQDVRGMEGKDYNAAKAAYLASTRRR